MTSSLIRIPTEIKVSVFGSCEALNDALHLSQVCQNLRRLFHTERRRIEKLIITSSHVYDYDFCLSKLLAKREDLAQHYRNLGRRLPDTHRPSIKVFETCLRTRDNKEGSTDEDIQRIDVRWKDFSFLRGLYVDSNVSKEFDRFRAAFASEPTLEEGVTIVPPGLDDLSIQTSHVNRVQFEQNNRFAGDFKARFHRILCLHSMAIVSLHFVKISTVEPRATEPRQEDPDIAEIITRLLSKEGVLAGGKTTEFNLDTRLDGLEVFDFLYMFLLRKIMPYHRIPSWVEHDNGNYPFEWRVAGLSIPLEILEWYDMMDYCRQVF